MNKEGSKEYSRVCVCGGGTVGVKTLGREEGIDGWQGGQGRLTGRRDTLEELGKEHRSLIWTRQHLQERWDDPG